MSALVAQQVLQWPLNAYKLYFFLRFPKSRDLWQETGG